MRHCFTPDNTTYSPKNNATPSQPSPPKRSRAKRPAKSKPRLPALPLHVIRATGQYLSLADFARNNSEFTIEALLDAAHEQGCPHCG